MRNQLTEFSIDFEGTVNAFTIRIHHVRRHDTQLMCFDRVVQEAGCRDSAVALLPLLQLSRAAFKGTVFTVVDRTALADTVASSAFMAAAIAATVAYAGRKGVELRVLPDPFPKTYAILTVALARFFAATIAISERSAASLASLAYNAVITVACEELIFRGLVYRLSERHEGDRRAVAPSPCPPCFSGCGI